LKIEKITVWPRCDPQLAAAINDFSEEWGPYSAESRKCSIFSLIRDRIDPAWVDLCIRFPALDSALMDAAWSRYQWERLWVLEPVDSEDEESKQKVGHAKHAFVPCGRKMNGVYVLSAFARHHGFAVLDRFLTLIRGALGGLCDTVLTASLDSLRGLASACGAKKSKSKKKPHGKINERRAHLRPACRFCDEQTELSAHIEGTPWPAQDIDGQRLRLSALYCNEHRPKAPFSNSVRAAYLKVKRSQSQFDKELERLERQGWSDTSVSRAKSGNKLVDEYICRFVALRLKSFNFDIGRFLLDQKYVASLDITLRKEARMLVDTKISDRKKEMMMLLASGLNQTATAVRLGIERQAVSKALQSIPANYRLDLLVDCASD
jgi:DNA-binding CsgD family transcriptional regulator